MISGAPAFAPSETPCSSRPGRGVFAGDCWGSEALRTMPLPPTQWSCRAERSRDTSTNRADTSGTATSVGGSPRRPAGGGSLVETTCFLGDPPPPPAYWSCRAKRSAVETPPRTCRTRPGPLPPWGALRSVPTVVGTLVETTCFLGDPPPPPATWSCRAERSAVETPPRTCRTRSKTPPPWGSLHAAPTAVGTLVETTCFLWDPPPPPAYWSCRAKRSGVETSPRIGRTRSGPLPP
jgi:hypothetical protein